MDMKAPLISALRATATICKSRRYLLCLASPMMTSIEPTFLIKGPCQIMSWLLSTRQEMKATIDLFTAFCPSSPYSTRSFMAL
jgi:hypothetical protein